MRPLRDLIPRALPPQEPGPVEPAAVLAVVWRSEPVFDASAVFDRALFGLTEAEVQELGPVLPHVCEVAFEAIERSGIRFDRLRTLRAATYLGASEPDWITVRDASFLADLLGMPGPSTTIIEAGAGAMVAVHHAVEALRSGHVDLALVAGDAGPGVGALVLARAGAPPAGGRVRASVLGTAIARASDDFSARSVACWRAALEDKTLPSSLAPGFGGLVEALGARTPLSVSQAPPKPLSVSQAPPKPLSVSQAPPKPLSVSQAPPKPLSVSQAPPKASPVVVSELGETATVAIVLGPPSAARDPVPVGAVPPRILGLSARTEPALRGLVARTLDAARSEEDLRGLAVAAGARPALEHRVAVVVGSGANGRNQLAAWLSGGEPLPASGYAVEASVAFVIPPAGAQFAGMTEGLYLSEPVYRAALDRMDHALRGLLPRSLPSLLFAPGGDRAFADPALANPVTFAVAFALSELLVSRGVVAGAVLGCGVGELAAAAIARAVDPEEAVRVAAERGRLLGKVAADAGRAVIGATEADARDLLRGQNDVDIVAVPTPERVVIGGTIAGVERALARASAAELPFERMTGFPNNTPLVDPILADFAGIAGRLTFQSPEIGFVSATSGRRTEHADAAFWSATLRGPLRFYQAVETLYALGCRSFVELSRPALLRAGERTLAAQTRPSWWFAALRPDTDDVLHLEDMLSALWTLGVPVDRGGLPPEAVVVPGLTAAELPTYAWDRRPLSEEVEERLDAMLVFPRPAPPDGVWVPELDVDELAARQTASTSDPSLLSPLLELGDGRPTPLPADRPILDSLGEVAWLSERAVTLVPIEEREDVRHADLAEGATPRGILVAPIVERRATPAPAVSSPPPSNRAPSFPPRAPSFPPPSAMVEVQLTPEPLPQSVGVPRATPEGLDEDASVVWEEGWSEAPVGAPQTGRTDTWVVLADRRGLGDYVARLLASAGHAVLRVYVDSRVRHEEDALTIEPPASPASWWPVLERVSRASSVRVLHLWSLGALEGDTAIRRTPFGARPPLDASPHWSYVITLLRALDEAPVALPSVRIHLATRGAVRPTEAGAATIGGAMWGLARILAVERPERFGGVIELDPEDEDPEALVEHLLSADPEPGRREFALRTGQRWRRKIEPTRHLVPAGPIDVAGTWVLGGDLDIHSLELASALVSRGVSRVFFVSPLAPAAEVLRGVLELQRKGIACIVVRADPTDERDLTQVITRISREAHVSGVVMRVAAAPEPLTELDRPPVLMRWRQTMMMASVLWPLATSGQRWLWSEGRALDGAARAGLPGIAGEALAALARLPDREMRGIATVVHAGAAGELSPGQAVRLLVRLGPLGGVHGVWRRI